MAENKKWSQKELVNSWTSAARICILDGSPLDNKTLLISDLLSGTGGNIPDGWYLSTAIPRYADGSVSSSWNSDPTILKTTTLHSQTAIRYRDLTKYVGGLVTSSMKAAWNDGEAMNV